MARIRSVDFIAPPLQLEAGNAGITAVIDNATDRGAQRVHDVARIPLFRGDKKQCVVKIRPWPDRFVSGVWVILHARC